MSVFKPPLDLSTVVVLLLLIHCILLLTLFSVFCVWSLFCHTVLSVHSSFTIILVTWLGRELVDLLCFVCLSDVL